MKARSLGRTANLNYFKLYINWYCCFICSFFIVELIGFFVEIWFNEMNWKTCHAVRRDAMHIDSRLGSQCLNSKWKQCSIIRYSIVHCNCKAAYTLNSDVRIFSQDNLSIFTISLFLLYTVYYTNSSIQYDIHIIQIHSHNLSGLIIQNNAFNKEI